MSWLGQETPRFIGSSPHGAAWSQRFLKVVTSSQKIIGIVVVATALLGWTIAAVSLGNAGELEERLMAAEADLTDLSDELAAARESLRRQQETGESLKEQTRQLGERAKRLEDGKAELVSLMARMTGVKAQLDQLRAETSEHRELLSGGALRYTTTTRAKMRSAPSTGSQELAVVPEGVSLEVFKRVEEGTWYKVGRIGYMYHELLEPTP